MSVFIVAESGVNHLGDRTKMLALCDTAKAAGADAIKVQAYNAEALVKRRGKGDLALLKQCELSDADLDAIAAHCKAIGIKWFASVFDPLQIERVLSRGACALKIGHAEADWDELLEACRARAPLWVSGGIGNVHGVWEYPATSGPWLSVIQPGTRIRGFSSHFHDYRIPAAAALRGAEYIEAHLMLGEWERVPKKPNPWCQVRDYESRCTTDEPEAEWSLSPDDFAAMVELIREYETWL